MSVPKRPHYVIKPSEIARWLDQEPGTWWMVDGDPRLMGDVDFPCPSGELSQALRHYEKDLVVYSSKGGAGDTQARGQKIKWEELGNLSDRNNPRKRRTFVLSWSDCDDEWLLRDYPASKLPELKS